MPSHGKRKSNDDDEEEATHDGWIGFTAQFPATDLQIIKKLIDTLPGCHAPDIRLHSTLLFGVPRSSTHLRVSKVTFDKILHHIAAEFESDPIVATGFTVKATGGSSDEDGYIILKFDDERHTDAFWTVHQCIIDCPHKLWNGKPSPHISVARYAAKHHRDIVQKLKHLNKLLASIKSMKAELDLDIRVKFDQGDSEPPTPNERRILGAKRRK